MSYLRPQIVKHWVSGALMSTKESPSNKKIKLLIVEDNPINRKIISLFLEELGYTNVIIAENGNKALMCFDPTFDLVLLDIGLPDISGIEVCKKMRQILQGKRLPILAVTAFSDDATKMACQDVGVDKIVLKPLTLDTLTETLKQWLH